jgi:hypothetical protein
MTERGERVRQLGKVVARVQPHRRTIAPASDEMDFNAPLGTIDQADSLRSVVGAARWSPPARTGHESS